MNSAPSWLEPIGWALLHFLWQGALISGAAGVALAALRHASAQIRYAVLCAALLACAIAPVATWAILQSQQETMPELVPAAVSGPAIAPLPAPLKSAPVWSGVPFPAPAPAFDWSPAHLKLLLDAALPWLVLAWGLGVGLLSLRLFHDWNQLRRICRLGLPPNALEWTVHLLELAQRMGVSCAVRLLETARVEVPTVIGWLRPVLLVPATFLTSLPPAQVDAILAHELAHIRRHDYLVNLFQIAIETLLFYHPAVWWLSRAIRQEREHACDDLALGAIGDAGAYAAALAALEESRSLPTAITLAATGGSLLHRIRRIAGLKPEHAGSRAWLAVLGLIILGASVIAAARAAEADFAAENDPLKGVDLTKQNFDARGNYDYDFHYAVIRDQLSLVAAFLHHGQAVNPNVLLHGGDDILGNAVWFTNDPRMVRLLLDHGAKPMGDSHDDHSTLSDALEAPNKEIADMLIAAGAPFDPVIYDAALGLLDDLKKREASQPIPQDQLDRALNFAIKAGQLDTFNWLWSKLQTSRAADDAKKLADCYALAAKQGRLSIMLRLEQLGVSAADVGPRAINDAIMGNRLAATKHLLASGVKIPPLPKGWRCQLGNAAGENHLEMAELLLDHGADINARDGQGLTPLSWAAYLGHEAVCRMLIDRGADLSIRDNQNQTAAWAAAGGLHSPALLELMLQKGAKIDGTNKFDMDILAYAMNFVPPDPGHNGFAGRVMTPAEYRDYVAREKRTIDLLVDAGLNPTGKAGTTTPLLTTIQANHYPAAEELLARGADPRLKNKDGNTALNSLLDWWHLSTFPVDLLRALMQHGCPPNDENPWAGMTPPYYRSILEEAVADSTHADPERLVGNRAAVAEIIRAGGTFHGAANAHDEELLLASTTGDIARMKAAVAAGASVSARAPQKTGWCPLMVTLALGYLDAARWLIDQGADINASTPNEGSVLALAVRSNQEELVSVLLSKGAKADSECLSYTIESGNQKLFDTLAKAGADPKNLSIFMCIQRGRVAMAKAILDHGGDPNGGFNSEKRGNVYWAIYYNQPEILKMLLDHGGDPELKTVYEETPLSRAKEQHPDMVPMIEEAIKRRHSTGKT